VGEHERGDIVGTGIEGAIRAAAAGELVFGAGAADRVAVMFSAPRRPRGADQFPTLTDRELVLLDLVAPGLDNASIAARCTWRRRRFATSSPRFLPMSVCRTASPRLRWPGALASGETMGLGKRDSRPYGTRSP
jgi:hypothetical protein